MKIDRHQSLKNKIGVVFSGTLLAVSLVPNFTLAGNSINIDYTSYYKDGEKQEIVIITRENMNDTIVLKDEFEYLISHAEGDIVIINGEELSKSELIAALNLKKEEQQEVGENIRKSAIAFVIAYIVYIPYAVHKIHKDKEKII